MEKKLSFAVKLSLEEMALRRSVINMWCENDVLFSIGDRKIESYAGDLSLRFFVVTLNNMVKEKISNLNIPVQLKKRMIDILKPIGADILRWKMFHENIFYFSSYGLGREVIKQLCWTSTGIVDYKETAEKLLRLDALVVHTRYELAALYCLVDYIPALWEQLSRSCKKSYFSEKTFWPNNIEMDFYWAYLFAKGESKLDDIAAEFLPQNVTFHQHAFERSAMSGNKAAVEYFSQKLTKEERNAFLVPLVYKVTRKRDRDSRRLVGYFPFEKLSEVLCYLISQMSPEQQLEVLKEKPYEVLSCFLDWPSQDIFLEIAGVFWAFLSEREYHGLLAMMIKSISESRYYMPNFFQEFFLRSPKECKKYFVDHVIKCGFFLSLFFRVEDTMTIKIIFRNINVIDKLRLLRSITFMELVDSYVMNDEVRMVKLCLEEAIPSRKKEIEIKRLYLKYLTDSGQRDKELKELKWLQVFRDIGKTNVSSSKKRPNNKTVRKVKKRRTGKK